MNHPDYGLERYNIKIIKRYNFPKGEIEPKIDTMHDVLSRLYIGREVDIGRVKNYITDYYREKDLLKHIVEMSIRTV